MSELVTTGTTALATNQPPAVNTNVTKSDIVIPKIMLMQGLSEAVADRKAQMGDIVKSTNFEKLGDDKKTISIVPLAIQNLWLITEEDPKTGSYKFRRYEPRNASNEQLEWDYIENGSKFKRTKTLNFFGLLPADIDAYEKQFEEGAIPDVDKALLPVMVPFRNTSFTAGRDVMTYFAKVDSLNAELIKRGRAPVYPYSSTLELGCYQDKNDKGTFFVFQIGKSSPTNKAYFSAAATWYDVLNSNASKVTVHEETAEPEVVNTKGFKV